MCDAIRQGMSPRRILQSLLGADCPPVHMYIHITYKLTKQYNWRMLVCFFHPSFLYLMYILSLCTLPIFQPEEMDNGALWRLLASLLMTPEPRNRLLQYNTVDRAVKLISDARNIIVLTGAGVRCCRSVVVLPTTLCIYLRNQLQHFS